MGWMFYIHIIEKESTKFQHFQLVRNTDAYTVNGADGLVII